MRTMMIAAALATGLSAAPVAAQQQSGLVNVVLLEDVDVRLNNIANNNNVNLQVPVTANIQVPIGIAAALCDVNANVLAQQTRGPGGTCTATNETASDAELLTAARSLQRQ